MSRARRDYWRKLIHDTAMRHGVILGLCKNSATQITDMPPYAQRPIADQCAELLDKACEAEAAGNHAETAIAWRADALLWNFMKPFQARSFDQPLSFD